MCCASSKSARDNQIAAIVLFDLDDFEAAIAELDARYLVGEAAPYARTWSVIDGNIALDQPARAPRADGRLRDDRSSTGAAFAPAS